MQMNFTNIRIENALDWVQASEHRDLLYTWEVIYTEVVQIKQTALIMNN